MTLIDRCNTYLDLLTTDNNTLNDLYAKYVMLADSYLGAAGTEVISSNKATFEVLLNKNIRTFIKYKKSTGELSKLIAENPNLGRLLDPSNTGYIENLVNKLKNDGWQINGNYSREALTNALSLFGIPSITSDDIKEGIAENADIIDIDDIANMIDGIKLDDDELDEMLKSQEDIFSTEVDPGEPEDYSNNEVVNPEDIAEEAARELQDVIEASKVTQDEAIPDFDDSISGSLDAVQQAISQKDQQIKDYVEQKETARKSKEIDEAIKEGAKESNQADMAVVNKTVKAIMAVYDVMYPDLFQETPTGILTSNGIVTVKSDNALQVMGGGNAYAQRLWTSIQNHYGNAIRELDYHNDVSMECINPDGTLKYNYAPYFHIHNIYGIYRGKDGTLKRERNWSKFRAKLADSLARNVTKILGSFKGDQLALSMSLIELFTTAFIAEDFDVNKSLKMSIKSLSISKQFGDCSDIGKMIGSGNAFPLDPTSVEIVNNSEEDLGVTSLLAVFDKKAYNSEILFAYKPLSKIIASGGRVGLSKTLLGRDIKGRNVTYNFESPQAVDSLVLAGSGSGKGVVTLNMLATFIAEGCPTVYVDYKPEMAAMLWDLERETGARILAVDGYSGNAEGVVPVRNYSSGYNKMGPQSIQSKLHLIPYIKSFELLVLCAKGRNMNYNGMTSKSKKMQFILDEAQQMNKELCSLKAEITEYLSENKPTKAKPETDEYRYVKRLDELIRGLFAGATEFRNTTGRTGNVGVIMLGQQSDCSAWATGTLKRDPFGFLVGNCSMKMLGKGAADNTKYSLNGATPSGSGFLGNMGYFALIDGALADKGNAQNIKVIKSYLVLNKNDYSEDGAGKFTGGMLKNVTDPVVRDSLINDDFYPMDSNGNRYVNPLVGFKGLVEYLGSNIPGFDLKANLEAGYIECEKLLTGLGILGDGGAYSCIEEYLFDCSSASMFTISELEDLMTKGETIQSLIDLDSDGTLGPSLDTDDTGFNDEVPLGGFSVYDNESQYSDGDQTKDTEVHGSQAFDDKLPKDAREMIDRAQRIDKEAELIDEIPQEPEFDIDPLFESSSYDGQEMESNQDIGGDEQEIPEGFSKAPNGEAVPNAPGTMPISDYTTFQYGGKYGKAIFITPEKTSKILGLSKENSVVVEMPPYSTSEKFSDKLFKSLWGSRYEFKSRWKAILDGFAGHIKADLICRAIISEDTIAFNKRRLAAINILGGQDDIRVEDIVDFTMTAKRFKNINEIMLDQTLFEAAQIEFGDPIVGLFKTFPNLNKLIVTTVQHTQVTKFVTRQDLMSGTVDPEMSKAAEKAKFKNQMEAIVATKNPNLRKKSPGYQNRVFSSCMKFQGEGWGSARDAIMSKNPKLFKAAGMSILTLGILGVGLTAGAIGKIGSLFRR